MVFGLLSWAELNDVEKKESGVARRAATRREANKEEGEGVAPEESCDEGA